MKYWGFGLGAVLSTACGGTSDAQSTTGLRDTTADTFVGIYQLTGKTTNEAGCAAPGPSTLIAARDQFFFVERGDVFGEKYLMLASCKDPTNCQDKRKAFLMQQAYGQEFSYLLTSETNATTLNGFSASTGTTDGGNQCQERTYAEHVLTRASDGALHLESRLKQLANRAQEDGFCTVEPDKSKSEAASKPCAQLETLDARFVQAF